MATSTKKKKNRTKMLPKSFKVVPEMAMRLKYLSYATLTAVKASAHRQFGLIVMEVFGLRAEAIVSIYQTGTVRHWALL